MVNLRSKIGVDVNFLFLDLIAIDSIVFLIFVILIGNLFYVDKIFMFNLEIFFYLFNFKFMYFR